MKRRAVVLVSGLLPKRGRPVLWAYGIADLAKLLGCSVEATRKLIRRGRFDPASLESVVDYVTKRRAGR